jgi:hypothetical protein
MPSHEMTSPDIHTDPTPIAPKRLAFLIAVPLAWGALLWFHPAVGPDSVYQDLRDQVNAYLIVHVGTLIFIGLMGVALYMLVRDLPGRAATISRLAIGPFVLFYAACEAIIGLAIGVLVQHGNNAPRASAPRSRTPSRPSARTPSWAMPAPCWSSALLRGSRR